MICNQLGPAIVSHREIHYLTSSIEFELYPFRDIDFVITIGLLTFENQISWDMVRSRLDEEKHWHNSKHH